MARGWESKSVEMQIESASQDPDRSRFAHLSAEEFQKVKERESLQLSRTRVLNDLNEAKNQGYRDKLEAALRHLDEKLAELL